MARFLPAIILALSIVGSAPTSAWAAPSNPVSSTWEVTDCTNDVADFSATWVFFPAPSTTPGQISGATSTLHIVGSRQVAIVFSPGTDRLADASCTFTFVGGASPDPFFAEEFEADVYFPPR